MSSINNRNWIVPAVLLLILVLAYGFRWEKGEEISKNSTKIIYYHDRWLGQSWYKYYSTEGFYELPVICDDLVDSKAQEIRQTDPTLAAELKSIDEQYLDLGALAETLVDKKRKYYSLHSQYIEEWYDIDQPLKLKFDFAKQEEYVQNRIPEDILQASYTYDTYANARQNLLQRKESIIATTKTTAKSELIDQAKLYRKISTFVLSIGFIIIVLWLLSYFWRNKAHLKTIDINRTAPINNLRNDNLLINHKTYSGDEDYKALYEIRINEEKQLDEGSFNISEADRLESFSLENALRFGWECMENHRVFSFIITTYIWLTLSINQLYETFSRNYMAGIGHLPILIGQTIIGLCIYFTIVKLAFIFADGEKPSFSGIISSQELINFTICLVLYCITVTIGYVLLIIPGIIFAARLLPAQFLTIDKDLGPIQALKKSWVITKGSTIQIFVIFLLYLIANFIGAFVTSIYGTFSAEGIYAFIPMYLLLPLTLFAVVYICRTLYTQSPLTDEVEKAMNHGQ